MISEPRSYAPIGEGAEVKTAPVSEKSPTMRGLARGLNALHLCSDATQEKVGQLDEKVEELKSKQAYLTGLVEGVAARVGAPTTPDAVATQPPHRSIASIRPTHALLVLAAVVGGAQGLPIAVKLVGGLFVAVLDVLQHLA